MKKGTYLNTPSALPDFFNEEEKEVAEILLQLSLLTLEPKSTRTVPSWGSTGRRSAISVSPSHSPRHSHPIRSTVPILDGEDQCDAERRIVKAEPPNPKAIPSTYYSKSTMLTLPPCNSTERLVINADQPPNPEAFPHSFASTKPVKPKKEPFLKKTNENLLTINHTSPSLPHQSCSKPTTAVPVSAHETVSFLHSLEGAKPVKPKEPFKEKINHKSPPPPPRQSYPNHKEHTLTCNGERITIKADRPIPEPEAPPHFSHSMADAKLLQPKKKSTKKMRMEELSKTVSKLKENIEALRESINNVKRHYNSQKAVNLRLKILRLQLNLSESRSRSNFGEDMRLGPQVMEPTVPGREDHQPNPKTTHQSPLVVNQKANESGS